MRALLSCRWVAWHPCRRPATTWGRWAGFARILWRGARLSVRLSMLLSVLLGLCRIVACVKHRVKQARLAVCMAVSRAVGTVPVVMPAVTCQARVPSRVALALMV